MSKVNGTGRAAIARVMSDAYDNVANIGRNVVQTICSAVEKVYRGADIPKEDCDAIVDELATLRGWDEKSAKVRKSEARAILSVYSELPNAAAKLADKGKGNWKDAVNLARKLRDGSSTKDAIAALTAAPKHDAKSKKKRAAMLLKSLRKLGFKAIERNIVAIANELNLNIGSTTK